VLKQLLDAYPNDLRMVYRHFPLSYHDKSLLTAQAAEAAGLQGKFWEMHDAIFAGAPDWSEKTPDDFKTWVKAEAGTIGLDVNKFNADFESQAIVAKVTKALTSASSIPAIQGTPFLMINGHPYGGAMDFVSLENIIRLIKLQDRQFNKCPEMTVDSAKTYTATIKTEKGDIVLQLYADKAPVAVNSFIFLAKNGWFDNTTFHRVLPNFVVQAGDPTGTGYGGPGYVYENEIRADLKFDKPGLLGMANSGPNSNASQFFITFKAEPQLDGKYTIFGQVISGMDVVSSLTPRDPGQNAALPPGDKIITITIEEQ
jgi:cyclophilin family peptidyl-prolyl cis-trans isomerase